MLVKKGLPFTNFTKIDNNIIEMLEVSDGAFRLYSWLAAQPDGATIDDIVLQKRLKLSRAVITRRKKELKDVNLILLDRVGPNLYNMYVGCSDKFAHRVKEEWTNRYKEQE